LYEGVSTVTNIEDANWGEDITDTEEFFEEDLDEDFLEDLDEEIFETEYVEGTE
jgi:hypothetical protein